MKLDDSKVAIFRSLCQNVHVRPHSSLITTVVFLVVPADFLPASVIVI